MKDDIENFKQEIRNLLYKIEIRNDTIISREKSPEIFSKKI